jgi:diaminohydroxyphosphoribosylaminopyrimidine deaminase/5-amino-6-(5-phosphoribosylamino)uracil reductase
MAAGASRHDRFMTQALRLARRGLGRTSPNPPVGALIVRRGRVVGQGFHRRAGAPHAEADALRAAGARARGATLYVTLEPCNHHGRTPPCCDAILRAGIRHVVAAARDPNPVTDGRGFARLRRAGVRVTTGVLAPAARGLIEPFAAAVRTRRPLVTAKAAQSLDGRIATARGESQWITSAAARAYAHRLRAQADAVLVGIETVLADDPRLDARGTPHRPDRPIKVILDSRLRLPVRARCLSRRSPAPTIVATTQRGGPRRRALERRGVRLLTFPARGGRVPLRPVLDALGRAGIQSVLIEGGGEVLGSAFAQRLVHRVAWFLAPVVIGGRTAPGAVGGAGVGRLAGAARIQDWRVRRFGPDLCIEGKVAYPGRAARRAA